MDGRAMLEIFGLIVLTFAAVMMLSLSRRSRRNFGLKNYDRRSPPDGSFSDHSGSGGAFNLY
jgi:hypothetical protein